MDTGVHYNVSGIDLKRIKNNMDILFNYLNRNFLRFRRKRTGLDHKQTKQFYQCDLKLALRRWLVQAQRATRPKMLLCVCANIDTRR